MAKKKKKQIQKPHREPTRRQLARWQYQKRRQRIIFTVGVTVITAIVAIVASGWYLGEYRPLHQTAIRVNDTEFNMKYYVDSLELMGVGESPQMAQLLSEAAIRNIEENELIRQGAEKLGISIGEEELEEKIKSSEVPSTRINRDIFLTQLLWEKLREEYFDKQVPQTAEQRHVMAMVLESESRASEVRERLVNGESFTELAGELTVEMSSKVREGDYGWHSEVILSEIFMTSVSLEKVLNAEVGVLSQPIYDEEITNAVGYWLLKVLDRDDEMEEAHVHAMLLGSEEETKAVAARLNEGEDFNTLAEEISQLPNVEEDRGDLGMITQGEYPPAFDEFVFDEDLEIGAISEPIRDETMFTKGGYWLIKVIGADDDRQIDEVDRDFLIVEAMEEWAVSLREDPDNEIDHSYLDAEKVLWALQRVTGQ